MGILRKKSSVIGKQKIKEAHTKLVSILRKEWWFKGIGVVKSKQGYQLEVRILDGAPDTEKIIPNSIEGFTILVVPPYRLDALKRI